jgi:glycosyltransferase involved in cell wall biosynthesis
VKADLLFSPTALVLPIGLVPVVVTIADVMPMRLPSQLFSTASAQVQKVLSSAAAHFSRRIITISECSKRDIVEVYGIPAEKVSVVYCGYNLDLFNPDPLDKQATTALLNRLDISKPYIFHHGTITPRKNFQRLVEAYGLVMDRKPRIDLQLVLAGSLGWQHEPVVRAGAALGGRKKVVFTGPLEEEDLARLLKASVASVIPSLYEGFCLPMVEAMGCGVPTIAASTSCLPEVSGGKLCYFDPLSIEDMADRIIEVLENDSLRRRLSQDGLRRAQFFSWEKCARETYDLLVQTYETASGKSLNAMRLT